MAKQFLTKAAVEKWSPEDGANIYRGSPTVNGDKVTLNALLIGTLDGQRSYTARDTRLHVDFKLTKRKASGGSGLRRAACWSLSRRSPASTRRTQSISSAMPPPGPGRDLPSGSAQSVQHRLGVDEGAAGWTVGVAQSAVTSSIPPNAALIGDAVTTSAGIATVPLSEPVMQLDDQQRDMMAAQVMYTLREALGVKGVLFTVNQQPLRVPVGDPVSFVVSADAIPRVLGPIPAVVGDSSTLSAIVPLRWWKQTAVRPKPSPSSVIWARAAIS